MGSNPILERFSGGRSIPPPAHPQRSTRNQSLRGPDARDTSGFHFPPRLAGEAVNAFCLPPASGKACHAAGPAEADPARQAVFDMIGRNAGLKRECDTRGFILPKFDDREEALGLVIREKL